MSSIRRKLIPRLRESKHRGVGTSKLTFAALDRKEELWITTKGSSFKPDQVIDTLKHISQSITNPSLDALSVLGSRAAASSEQYFPPQIVEVLSLMGKVGGCADPGPLMSLLTDRLDDVVNEASPRRIVILLEALANLEIILSEYPTMWLTMRAELVRLIPQLKRGIPSVLQSLSRMGCCDAELFSGLLTQAECLYTNREIENEYFVDSLEAASRIPGLEQVVAKASQVVNHSLTCRQKAILLAAHLRLDQSSTSLVADIETAINSNGQSYEGARLLGVVGRLGIELSFDAVSEFLETNLNGEFSHKMGPYSFLNSVLTSSPSCDDFFRLILSKRFHTGLDRLSADKLLCLFRAAHIVDAHDDSKARISSLLTLTRPQLSLRESRYLWEVLPDGPCPYRVRQSDDSQALGLVMPRFEAYRPGSMELRRDAELRLNSVKRAFPQQEVSVIDP